MPGAEHSPAARPNVAVEALTGAELDVRRGFGAHLRTFTVSEH
jgi:hypothetical protein